MKAEDRLLTSKLALNYLCPLNLNDPTSIQRKDRIILVIYQSTTPLSEDEKMFVKTSAAGAELIFIDHNDSLAELVKTKRRIILISENPDAKFFTPSPVAGNLFARILLTSEPMENYSARLGVELSKSLDLVISGDLSKKHCRHELRIALQKMIKCDLFGIEKYLLNHCKIYEIDVRSSKEREKTNNEVQMFAEKNHLSSHFCRAVSGISEEFLTNAIYSSGHKVDRNSVVELDPEVSVKLRYGFDGDVFALGVEDNLGVLQQEVLMSYVHKILLRRDSDSLVDTKKSGAGLGFFKILYSCHSLVCNIDPGKRTEFIALIYPEVALRDFSRMARSIGFFSTQKQ